MKTNEQSTNPEPPMDEEKAFADYLREHPDFFQRHPSLLAQLVIPHPASGRAISLLERQVMALRDEQGAEQRRLKELVRNARENDRLGRRIEELTLSLLGAPSLDDLIENLPRRLRKIFDLEYVSLRLETEAGSDVLGDEFVDARCGASLTGKQLEWLFAQDADDIRSVALVPLKSGKQPGRFAMLAIGSAETTRYQADSGTHYLKQLQRLLSASIAQLSAFAER